MVELGAGAPAGNSVGKQRERRALVGAAVAGVCTDQEMTHKMRRFHAGSRIIEGP